MAAVKYPVTILNEMMAKAGITPVYELCPEDVLGNPPQFTFKVICNGMITYGTGTSKKEAKHNAASAMIEQIGQQEKVRLQSNNNDSNTLCLSTQDNGTDDTYKGNVFTDLQKFCNQLRLDKPFYKEIPSSIPGTFTFQYSLATCTTQATARTKRQARFEAALKMLRKLEETFNIKFSSSIGDSAHEEENANANSFIKPMQDTQTKPTNNNIGNLIINYHLNMQSKRTELAHSLQEATPDFLQNLEYLSSLISQCEKQITGENLTKLKREFEDTLHSTNIDFHHMLLQTSNPESFMLIIQLNTDPDILEMGLGSTRDKAELCTVRKIVETLKMLYK